MTILINRYDYFLYENNVKGKKIAFAEQERFAFREAVTVWTNDTRAETLFTIKAEKILDVHGKFLVHDAAGNLVGYCRKSFGASLLRSTWEVYNSQDQLLFYAKEKSLAMAIIRRVAQFVPYLDEIAPFFPFNFILERDARAVGTYTRVWGRLADQYALELSEPAMACDRRVLLALGILLDALQDR